MAKRSTKELVLSGPTPDEEYEKKAACPKCGSTDLYLGSVEFGHDTAFIQAQCNDCEHTWTEVYALEGIVGIVGYGTPQEQEFSDRRVARPDRCPYCEAETTDYQESAVEFPRIYQTVHCDHCPQNWQDVYKFNRVDE